MQAACEATHPAQFKDKGSSENWPAWFRKDIARLYPDSRQIWVDSGHGIPLEKPESVISVIREVLSIKQSNISQVK